MEDSKEDNVPVQEQHREPQSGLGFEDSFKFDKPDTQLAIRNQGRVNRQLATHETLGRTGYSAYVRHVQYGSYQEKPACLVVVDFSFRFPTRSNNRFTSAYIEVRFEKAPQGASEPHGSEDRASSSPDDPEVVNFAPKQLSDNAPTERKVNRLFELEVPFKVEVPYVSMGFSFKRSAGWARTEEGRGRVHGGFYQDDDHDDGANGVTWDVEENHVSKEGIVRDLRTLVMLRWRPEAPFLMHVRVKPVVSFALDARRLVRRLVGERDEPVALDGCSQMGNPECLANSNFDSEDFPWHALLIES
ncbi:hypothetical protein PFICI_03203 [Pestalotiopsis fici W106-1]|uniref:Uncharacterized protein n=1 Tax=Pestalotiopsis fici (strain W106-1 / CGMCC3.15140) TaxID=1229662 RepID=W3XGF9_PESFW|nr:uncharacterized protein PFICI_03203 [Pestalotiopsis fici W106-1]ETS85178.1 hypothetical protein PFICI_03203 [Pestalotiopsis fici W106-1]